MIFRMFPIGVTACMRAVTTAIPRCCSAPQNISPKHVISPVRSTSSSASRRKRRRREIDDRRRRTREIPGRIRVRHAHWPELPSGQFAVQPGPMMAAFDIFEIVVKGRGAHAAMPHLAIDPIVAAAQVVTGLQTIASRNVHPLEGAVVSVTQFHSGDTWDVIPETVVLRGTTRSFNPALRDRMNRRSGA